VKVAEQFADELLSEETMLAHWLSVVSDPNPPAVYDPYQPTAYDAVLCTVYGRTQQVPPGYLPASPVRWAVVCAQSAGKKASRLSHDQESEKHIQAAVVHDIFGNLFRPATIDPSWLAWNDGTIPELAQSIYEQRAFDRLLVLADALEVAGCTNADILTHCRHAGPHVQGCWVLDLLLGKA
jgi:hypothetical protein